MAAETPPLDPEPAIDANDEVVETRTGTGNTVIGLKSMAGEPPAPVTEVVEETTTPTGVETQTTTSTSSTGKTSIAGSTTQVVALSQKPVHGGGHKSQIPIAPSGLSATVLSDTSIRLNWTDNSNNETAFLIERCTGSGCANFVQVGSVSSGVVTFTDTGLQGGTSYRYRVRATNSFGNSAYTSIASAVTTLTDITPPVISGVASSGVTTGAATITWNTDEGSDSQVEYGLTTAYGSSTSINASPVQAHTVGLTGLLANTTYHYRVKSRDLAGNQSVSGDFSFTTSPSGGIAANAGPDRTVFVNEVVSLDGSGSAGSIYDGFQSNGHHSIRWDFGYGGFTYEGGLIAPVAYPEAGTYTVTLTVYDSFGNSSSDTAVITVNAITLGSETILSDTGNPVTNMTNLQAAIDAATGVNNKVITLPAGFVARGTLIPKHRVANYCTIRTANHASLPSSKRRVSPSDVSNMAIIEQSLDANMLETPATSTSPANYYNFIGVWFRKATASSSYTHTFIQLGQGDETALNQLPHHFLFDRCFLDGGSTTSNTLRGINFRATDSGIVNSYLYRFKGVGIETQAVLILMGERIAIMNNYVQGASENSLIGGGDPTIANHIPNDIVFRRNHYQKDVGWRAGDPAYYGVDMSVKNIFELKLGNRISVQGNRFEDHWIEDQSYAITFTPRNQDGNAPWSTVQYVDFSFNRIHRCGRGVEWTGTDDLHLSGIQNHIIFRDDVWTGVSYYNGNQNTYSIFGAVQHLAIIRNSTDQNGDPFAGVGRWIEFDATTGIQDLIVWGNIGQGFINSGAAAGAVGDAAFQLACLSYSVLNNGFYRGKGTNPSGNLSVPLISDVHYTDLTNGDLMLTLSSPFLAAGLAGGRAGADISTLNAFQANVITGAW